MRLSLRENNPLEIRVQSNRIDFRILIFIYWPPRFICAVFTNGFESMLYLKPRLSVSPYLGQNDQDRVTSLFESIVKTKEFQRY